MKVAILDDWEHRWSESPHLARLRERFDVAIADRALAPEEIGRFAAGADALILNRERTRLTAALLALLPALRVVASTGTGLSHIDRAAAAERKIPILTSPPRAGSTPSVVEQTFALILAVLKQLPALDRAIREDRYERPIVGEMSSRTLGVAGLGKAGSGVVRVARAFGMPVVGWSRSLDDARAAELGIARARDLPSLAAACDVFTVHLASNAETRGIVDAATIAALRPGAVFVNTARAEVVDRAALLARIARGDLLVGLDVFDEEPIPPGDPIRRAPGALSPHLGWMTDGTWERFITGAIDGLLGWASSTA